MGYFEYKCLACNRILAKEDLVVTLECPTCGKYMFINGEVGNDKEE